MDYETLNLITDKPRPLHFDYKGDSIEFEFDEETSFNLKEFSQRIKY